MKIYTKTGDSGTTSLFGGTRISKKHIRIESYGTIDELNAYIGILGDQEIAPEIKNSLLKIQHDLFTLGAMLATPRDKEKLKNGKDRLNIPTIDEKKVLFLEHTMDEFNKDLPKMTHFILPGGHQTVSYCHIARCVCRRAERIVVALDVMESVNPNILKYLNRLSDFLFVLARKLSFSLKIDEVKWMPEKL